MATRLLSTKLNSACTGTVYWGCEQRLFPGEPPGVERMAGTLRNALSGAFHQVGVDPWTEIQLVIQALGEEL